MNVDKYGLLGQMQPDGMVEGGDSVKWNGDKYYLTGYFPYQYTNRTFSYFYGTEDGGFVRHPDPDCTFFGFGADPRSASRDQRTGYLAGLIAQQKSLQSWDRVTAYNQMRKTVKHHAKRLFLFADNTIHNGVDPKDAGWKMPDPTGPEILAQQLRGLRPGWYDWLLPILDLHMLINTWRINSVSVEDEDDCIAYLIKLMVSVEHKPTWVSRLSLRLVNAPRMLLKLKSYWCGWREQPEMQDIYYNRLCQLKEKEYAR